MPLVFDLNNKYFDSLRITTTKMLRCTISLEIVSLPGSTPSSESCAAAITLISTLPSLIGIMGNETEVASLLFTLSNMTADF